VGNLSRGTIKRGDDFLGIFSDHAGSPKGGKGRAHQTIQKKLHLGMSVARLNDPIEPMDLAKMRENGVRSLAVRCHQCHHETIINADHWPGDLTITSFFPRMVCTACGTIGADVTPNWPERERW
jgi:ribosomal protein S27E